MKARLGVLVIAHSNIKLLCESLKRLDSKNICIYLHLDKKSTITEDEYDSLHTLSNLILINDNDRIKVNWGGRSQVDVMLLLIRKALEDPAITNVCFISGSDYLISTTDELVNYVSNCNVDIMRIDRILKGTMLNRVLNLNLYDFAFLNPRNYSVFTSKFIRLVLFLFKKIRLKKLDGNLEYYHGSSWFCLKRSTALLILDYINNNYDFYRGFMFAFGSDEVFFQTIIKRLNIEITQDYSLSVNNEINYIYGLTYIDWQSESNNLVGGPKLLDIQDIENIKLYKNKGAFFVRKVSLGNNDFLEKLKNI